MKKNLIKIGLLALLISNVGICFSKKKDADSYSSKNEVIPQKQEVISESNYKPSINPNDKTVSITTFGEGKDKNDAIKKALRNAIEKAFGAFVSSKTEILNDELISDDIVLVSHDDVQSFKEISSTQLSNGNTLYMAWM